MRSALRVRGACAPLLALLSGCGGAAAGAGPARELLVVVELPRGALDAAVTSFRDPYPSGARLVARDPARPEAPARLLSAGFDSAGAPCVDADGGRLLFVGRREAGASWRIWELALSGGGPRALSPEGADASSACWLPDGRVVYSCDLEGTLDPFDGGRAYSLYVTSRKDVEPRRLTFDPSSEVDPTVLADGRILYAVRQAAGPDRAEGSWAFLTIANDGTGVSGFCGSHSAPESKRRPRQVGERLAYLAGGPAAEQLVTVPMRRPLSEPETLATEAGGAWRSADDLDGERLLVSHRREAVPGEPASYGLSALDPRRGELEPLLDDPTLDEVDAVLARRRQPARDKLSLVDPARPSGELLVLDARLSDRAWTVEAGAGPAATLEVLRARPRRATATAGAAFELDAEVLARVPLAADGSAFLEVPADVPLRLRTLDAAGRTVLDSHGWVWVRPAEKRGCIGCHSDRERAPANRFPDALAGDDPRPFVVGTRGVAGR